MVDSMVDSIVDSIVDIYKFTIFESIFLFLFIKWLVVVKLQKIIKYVREKMVKHLNCLENFQKKNAQQKK